MFNNWNLADPGEFHRYLLPEETLFHAHVSMVFTRARYAAGQNMDV